MLGRYEQLDLGRTPSGSVSATTGITPPTLIGLCEDQMSWKNVQRTVKRHMVRVSG